MSFAPRPLRDLAALLKDAGFPVLGLVGDEDHTSGYHLGEDRIYDIPPGRGDDDYSVKTPRDRAGLSDAVAAIDIGRHDGRLDDLALFLVAESKAGRAPDIREVTFEGFDGSIIRRWDAYYGRHTTYRTSLTGLHHIHVGYFRDSEFRNKTDLFQKFLLPDTSAEVPVLDFTFLYDQGRPVTATVTVLPDPGIKYLDLSDGLLKPIAAGVDKQGVKVRMKDPIKAGAPRTDEWMLGWLIGDNAAFILDRNVSAARHGTYNEGLSAAANAVANVKRE
jgi:hypothetical protein